MPVESGHRGLFTKLNHAESGQWQSSLMVMPLPKADPQGYGSALTMAGRPFGFARRCHIFQHNQGFEIVSHPGMLHYWHQEEEAISGLLQQSKVLGCDAEPQGLHIPISKSLMREGHRIRFQSFFDANKTLMPKIARRSDCGYCKHKALSRWDWKNAANNPDRYQAVNWQNPRTVEVRMFRGTLKPDEFMASIEFCHAVHQFTKNQVSLATIANGDSWNSFCAFIRHDSRYAELGKYLASHGLMEDRQWHNRHQTSRLCPSPRDDTFNLLE